MRSWTWSKRAAALALIALAAVAADAILHGGHEDDHCAACHARHISAVTPEGAASPIPFTALHHRASNDDDGAERQRPLGIHPTRGPPA